MWSTGTSPGCCLVSSAATAAGSSGNVRGHLCCGEMWFGENVDGGGQGKDVVRLNQVRITAGPNMCQVKDFKCKFAGVRWESVRDSEIKQEVGPFWLLTNCKDEGSEWVGPGDAALEHPLEDEGVADDARTYAVVFERSFELQNVLDHQRASQLPKRDERATIRSLGAADM